MSIMTLEEKKQIYYSVMRSVKKMLDQQLNELKATTVKSAAKKASERFNKLVRYNDTTKEYFIDPDAFKEYIATIKEPALKKRFIKLYNEDKLADRLVAQTHILSNISQSDLEWIRDNTDISLSPEFFEGNEQSYGKGYKNTSRKPTRDEHDFFRFFNSCGTDTEGMTPENIERYRKAWRGFIEYTLGIDPMMI
jgi:hypothetical protein